MKGFAGTIQAWYFKAFNIPVLQKSRLQWIDYLRGIAIVLVVYRHVLLGIERSGIGIPTSLINANMIFYSFRMPLFFILSGIFISSSIAKRTVKQLAYIKFENLLYPYLIWSFIQVTIQIIFSQYTNANRSFIDYTYILYQPRELDQFWYLPALFNTTIIYLLIKTKLKPAGWVQLLIGLLFYYFSTYFQRISMISDWMEFYIFFAIGDTISSFFFRESSQRFLKNPLTLVLITPIFILVQLYYLQHEVGPGNWLFLFIALIGCLSMFILAFRMQAWKFFPFLRVLGYHSLYIYVMHVIIAAFIRFLLVKVFGVDNSIILLCFGILFGVTLPVIFYNLFIRDNVLWFLFSLKKPSRYLSKNSSTNREKTD